MSATWGEFALRNAKMGYSAMEVEYSNLYTKAAGTPTEVVKSEV